MKRHLFLWVLIVSIAGELCAQQTKADRVFEIPRDFYFNRKFYVDLGTGNRMMVELSDLNDLQRIANIDSLLKVCLKDLTPLQDTLSDPFNTKTVDYVIDTMGTKKIRFQQFPPKGSSYVVQTGDVAALKITQDTLRIIGITPHAPASMDKIARSKPRYYRITFYVNNLSDLMQFTDGRLKQKAETFRDHYSDKWTGRKNYGPFHMKQDPSISADQQRGVAGAPLDAIFFNFNVNLQNYKNYFVPSFSLGAGLMLANRERAWRREIALFWEPHFLFAKDAQDKMQTFRNDFLNLVLSQGPIKEGDLRKEISFLTTMSFGYLIYRQGEYFDKGTIRFGAGKLKLHKTTLEPSMYFTDFFRHVTPSLRITQQF